MRFWISPNSDRTNVMPTYKNKKQPEKKFRTAQHFLECKSCDTEPAKYHCNTCSVRLCENCKIQHETGKTTQDHVAWLLSEYLAEEASQITRRKIIRNLKEEQKKIQSVCIPSLIEIKGEEKSKKENISIRVKEMKQQIEEHNERIVAKFKEWKEEAILALEREETIATNVIDKIIDDTDEQIVQLNRRCIENDETLTLENNELEEKMCKNLHKKSSEPIKSSYHLSEFRPGNMEKKQIKFKSYLENLLL